MGMEKIGYMSIFDNVGHSELYQSTLDNHIYVKIGTAYVRFSEENLKIYGIFKDSAVYNLLNLKEKIDLSKINFTWFKRLRK